MRFGSESSNICWLGCCWFWPRPQRGLCSPTVALGSPRPLVGASPVPPLPSTMKQLSCFTSCLPPRTLRRPSPVPQVSLVIMKIVLQPVRAGVGRQKGPLCGGGVFKSLCFTDGEGTSDCSQVTAADPRGADWSGLEAAQLRCSQNQQPSRQSAASVSILVQVRWIGPQAVRVQFSANLRPGLRS